MSFAWGELEEKYFKHLLENSICCYFERLIKKSWCECKILDCKRLTKTRFYYAKCNIEIHKSDLKNLLFENVEVIIDRQGYKTKLKKPLYFNGKIFIDRGVYALNKKQPEYIYTPEDEQNEISLKAMEKWESIMEEMSGVAYITEHGSKQHKEELILELETALKILKEE